MLLILTLSLFFAIVYPHASRLRGKQGQFGFNHEKFLLKALFPDQPVVNPEENARKEFPPVDIGIHSQATNETVYKPQPIRTKECSPVTEILDAPPPTLDFNVLDFTPVASSSSASTPSTTIIDFFVKNRNDLLTNRPFWCPSKGAPPTMNKSKMEAPENTATPFFLSKRVIFGRKALESSHSMHAYTLNMGFNFSNEYFVCTDGMRRNKWTHDPSLKQKHHQHSNRTTLSGEMLKTEEKFKEHYPLESDGVIVALDGGNAHLRMFGRPPLLALIYRRFRERYIPIAATIKDEKITIAVQAGDIMAVLSIEFLNFDEFEFEEKDFNQDMEVLTNLLKDRFKPKPGFSPLVAVALITSGSTATISQ